MDDTDTLLNEMRELVRREPSLSGHSAALLVVASEVRSLRRELRATSPERRSNLSPAVQAAVELAQNRGSGGHGLRDDFVPVCPDCRRAVDMEHAESCPRLVRDRTLGGMVEPGNARIDGEDV